MTPLAHLTLALLAPATLAHNVFPGDFPTTNWEQAHRVLRQPLQGNMTNLFDIGTLDWMLWASVSVANTSHNDGMVYLDDYRVVKVHPNDKDGELWTAVLPVPEHLENHHVNATNPDGTPNRPDVLDVTHSGFQKGFSLVVNSVNHRLPMVAAFANVLMSQFGYRVNTNLYLTPNGARAFEPHFDWMEAIVVQITGRKKWFLYSTPIHLPRSDQKFKPTAQQVGQPALEFVLNAGDMLYVPSGMIHSCESMPGDMPSLHLTYGVEVDPTFMWEGVVRDLFVTSEDDFADQDSFVAALFLVRVASDVQHRLRESVRYTDYLLHDNVAENDQCSAEQAMRCIESVGYVNDHLVAWKAGVADQVAQLAKQGIEGINLPTEVEIPLAKRNAHPTVETIGFEADEETLQRFASKTTGEDWVPRLERTLDELVNSEDRLWRLCIQAVESTVHNAKTGLATTQETQAGNLERHANKFKERYESWVARMGGGGR